MLIAAQEKAEFLFDQRRNWFQITCQVEDELEIKKVLKQYLEEFEEEVLDEGEDLVDGEGALVVSPVRPSAYSHFLSI